MRAALPWLIWLTAVGLAAIFIICMAANQADARARGGDFQCSHPDIKDDFDAFFATAARRHLPAYFRNETGGCILKALCFIESGLDPDAVSAAGATGLCQLMPATAADLEQRGKWRGKLRSAKDSAMGIAAVYAQFWHVWTVPRTFECRHELTIASENAGPKHIIDAQTESGGKLCWEGIGPHLHKITGPRHSRETLNHVSRFWAAWRKLRGAGL